MGQAYLNNMANNHDSLLRLMCESTHTKVVNA